MLQNKLIRALSLPLLALALLASPACGGEGKKDDKSAKADAKDAKKDASKDDASKDDAAKEDEGPKPSMDSPEGRVVLAAMVATEIAGAPDQADEILDKNGLDRDKLDALMFEIAKDPELSKAYKEQRMAS